jgi:hypothetical protein
MTEGARARGECVRSRARERGACEGAATLADRRASAQWAHRRLQQRGGTLPAATGPHTHKGSDTRASSLPTSARPRIPGKYTILIGAILVVRTHTERREKEGQKNRWDELVLREERGLMLFLWHTTQHYKTFNAPVDNSTKLL